VKTANYPEYNYSVAQNLTTHQHLVFLEIQTGLLECEDSHCCLGKMDTSLN